MTTWQRMLLVTVVAAAPRIARLLFVDVVEGDGTEYCRLAERLLAGEGYRGMLAGEERMFPPLFPWLIAGAMQVFGVASEVAARGLSFVSGLALPPLLMLLGTRCATPRAGLATGLLAALLPGFVLASAATYCEATQLTLFAGAVLCLTSVARTHRILPAVCGGLLLGAAYLVRAESFVPAILAGILLAVLRGGDGSRAKAVTAFFVIFLVTCAPYPLYLHRVTGQLRIEGKSERVLATVERFAEGRPYFEANYALAPDDRGPWLDPNAPWDGASKGVIVKRSGIAIFWRTLRGMVGALVLYGSGHSVGSLLFLIAAFFAFRGRADPGRRFADFWLLALCAFFVFATGLYKPVLRYLLPLGLASAVFGGRAVDELLRRYAPRRSGESLGPAGIGLVALLTLSAGRGLVTGFREFGDAHPRHRPARELGLVLADHEEAGRIMSDDVRVAFHGKREWTPIPVASTAELFVARLRDQEVVLFCWNPRRRDAGIRPGPWFDPDAPPAALVPLAVPGPYRVFRVR